MTVPFDRTKQVVRPFALALSTQRRGSVSYNPYVPRLSGLHGMSGLSGIFDDILQAGTTWLDNKLSSSGISGTDIVTIQNQVGAAMDQLSAEYVQLRDASTLTVAIISQFQQAMQTLINSFCTRCRQINTSRALAGCATIQYWGGKWIQDREAEKARLTTTGLPGVNQSIIDPVTGLPLSFNNVPTTGTTVITSTYLPLILGAVFVFAMMKSSKRW